MDQDAMDDYLLENDENSEYVHPGDYQPHIINKLKNTKWTCDIPD